MHRLTDIWGVVAMPVLIWGRVFWDNFPLLFCALRVLARGCRYDIQVGIDMVYVFTSIFPIC